MSGTVVNLCVTTSSDLSFSIQFRMGKKKHKPMVFKVAEATGAGPSTIAVPSMSVSQTDTAEIDDIFGDFGKKQKTVNSTIVKVTFRLICCTCRRQW